MTDIYLKTKQDVKNFLEILVEESITKASHDVEKDKQQRLAHDINKLKEADDEEKKKEADDKEKKKEASEEKEAKPETDKEVTTQTTSPIEKPEADIISAQSIIDKLNSIRSGKSLKDKKVNKAMVDYFNSLTPG
jgi:septal ring factor EnvC (AmiA/AmiB activator)